MTVRDLIPRRRARAPLLRSEETHPLVSLHQEMNRLFDEFWRDVSGTSAALMADYGFPRVEILETERELTVAAELPGLDEKDVEVTLHGGVLTLRGERRSESEDRQRRVSERYYGRFERQIELPAEVDVDRVSAVFRKGVLTVTLPKSAQAVAEVRRIPITAK